MKHPALLSTLLLVSGLLAGACTGPDLLNSPNDTANKIEVTGYLDASKIKTTTSSPLNSSTEVLVTIIGVKEAAPANRELTAKNMRSSVSKTTLVAPNGSFVVSIPALFGDTINLTVQGVADPTPVDTETFPDQPEFPEIAVDGLHIERSEEEPHYVFIGIELLSPLNDGFLEIINLTNEDYAVLELDPHWGEEEEGMHDGDEEDPGEDDPGEDDPGEDDPGEDDPGEEDPGEEGPGEEGPGEEGPGEEGPGEEDAGEEGMENEEDRYYYSQISAEPTDILIIVHNNGGVLSEAIELVAP